MYLVAITRWGRPLDQELADLSAITGVQPYDLRLRLLGALPVVVAGFSDTEEARRLMTTLKARTHGAVAIDLDKIPSVDQMMNPRSFELGATSITVFDPANDSETLPYTDVLALIHAQQKIETSVTSVSESRKFSASRAVITGGLLVTKKSSKEKREIENAYEQVVYLFQKPCRLAFVLRQNRLLYSSLGERIRHSSTENFSTLVGSLRERAPEALYDNRLLTRRSRANFEQISKAVSTNDKKKTRASVSRSNAFESDLVAHLIAVAHYRGQL